MGRVRVVLVHGARTSRTMWRAQIGALTRAGVEVRAPDLPGHGRRRGETFSVHGAVDAVAEAADDLGGPVVVAGVSLGGYVAIEHRAAHPSQCAGLLASGCCTAPSTPLRRVWLAATRGFDSLPDGGGWFNAALVSRAMTAQGARDLAEGGFALEAMTPILRDIGRYDPLAALRRASSPVWFVNGRYDHFRSGERSFLAAAREGMGTGASADGAEPDGFAGRGGSAPSGASAGPGVGARLILIPHARHLVSLDAPVAYNRVLLDFVARIAAASSSARS